MYLGFSDAQTSSVEGILKNRISSYQSLQFALEQFIFASPSLTGETYDSAKRYSQIILIPLLKACILLDEAITSACAKLPSEYRNHVDSMDLRESELVGKIYRADRLIGRYVDLIYLEYRKDTPNYPYISNLRSGEILQRRVKSQLEDKLRKLREYNAVSSKFFSDIPQLANAINTALRQTRTSWDSSSQTFVIPSSKELEWAKTVEEKWEKRIINSEENLYERFKEIMDTDAAKRLSQVLSLLPNKFTESVLKSDGFWEILYAVEKSGAKGYKAVDLILERLAKYEGLGKNSIILSKLVEYTENIATPVETLVRKGLEKVTGISSFGDYITKGSKVTGLIGKGMNHFSKGAKLFGKLGTVFTFADLGITAVSSGVNEFVETKNIGKAAVGGTIEAVKKVGFLEGATIGGSIGGAIGTAIPVPVLGTLSGATVGALAGAAIGGANQLAQFFNPHLYDDVKDFAYKGIDAVGKGIENISNTVSSTIGGIGKMIGFG